MLRHNTETTKQLDNTYRNVAEEGKGTHRYYLIQKRNNNRKLIEVVLFFIILVLIAVLAFALVDGHGYFQQWHIIIKEMLKHVPGHINANEVK